MKALPAILPILLAFTAPGSAASIVNNDDQPYTVIVTEGAEKVELALEPGAQVEFCPVGCFVTWPDGDRQALTGDEVIEISGGQERLR